MPKTVDRSKRIFSGPSYKTFEEAFPEIKDIKFEYNLWPSGGGPFVLNKSNLVGIVTCPNPLCTEGGFEIDFELSLNVFRKKLNHYEGAITCCGHEHMGSRWKVRRCLNHLSYKVDVEYKE